MFQMSKGELDLIRRPIFHSILPNLQFYLILQHMCTLLKYPCTRERRTGGHFCGVNNTLSMESILFSKYALAR